MFNKPLSEITVTDVENFCREWPEGIRVEYKSQIIDAIPKTISPFANTLGGILVIGATTGATNKVVFPIGGIDERSGLEEQIIQASVNGLYPGVLPEVRVLNIPGSANKVVIVVKVHESMEAPHAIQNTKRVYIRTGNLSNPLDSAEIDRIEYLLKRREKPERLRDNLIAKSDGRFCDHVGEVARTAPYVGIEVTRLFPREPIVPPEAIY